MEFDDNLVKEVSDAIYGATVKQALEMAATVPVDCKKIQSTLDEAKTNTDRATAILIFALIDDLFIYYYSLFLNKEISGGVKSLFDGNGMLSTAHNRITLAASLYWVSKATYKDLKILKKIRNEFAHKTTVHTFSEQPVESLVLSLEPYENAILKNSDLKDLHLQRKLSVRELFLLRSGMLIKNLVSELILYRSAITHQVGIRDMHSDWDKAPDNVKEISRCIARFSLQIIQS